jgi:hypothetical protein
MAPNDRKNIRELFGNLKHSATALEVGGNADDLADAGLSRSLNDLREFVAEIGIVQMSMRVVERWHAPDCERHFRNAQPRMDILQRFSFWDGTRLSQPQQPELSDPGKLIVRNLVTDRCG